MRRTRTHFYAGGPGTFSPAQLFAAAAGAWWDPSDKSTLFQSGTRAAPGAAVVNDGDPVGLVLDKSGGNNDLVQATAGSRPLWRTAGGLSWLQFDGAAAAIGSAASVDLSTFGQLGFAAGFTPASNTIGMVAEFGPNVNTTAGSFFIAPSNPGAGQLSATVNGGTVRGSATTAANWGSGVASVLTLQSMDITNADPVGSCPVRVNGAAPALTAQGTAGSAAKFGNLTVNVGARAGASLFYGGKLFGMLIRGGALSAGELAKIETWMGAKTGLVL